jgi:alanine racemase
LGGSEPAPRAPGFHVDLGAVAANVEAVRRLVGPGVWICPALKADAYGFGLVPVAHTVLAAGADAVATGSITQALRLRRAGISAQILVYGGDLLDAGSVHDLEEAKFIATAFDAASLEACLAHARRRLAVFLEVDVGLGRLGFEPPELESAAARVRSSGRLDLRGVYTHMSAAPDADDEGLRLQFLRFREAVARVGDVRHRMAASSRVLDRFPEMALEAVDPGRAVYGLLPGSGGSLGPRLRPAFAALTTRLLTVRPDAGGRRVGVLPFGRAAGLATLNAGCVLVRGRRAPLLGAPSLEHARVDLSRAPQARPGDEVVVVGSQEGECITVEEVLAAHPDLPETALALQVGASVPRLYSGVRESRDPTAGRTAAPRTRPSRPGPRSAAPDAG